MAFEHLFIYFLLFFFSYYQISFQIDEDEPFSPGDVIDIDGYLDTNGILIDLEEISNIITLPQITITSVVTVVSFDLDILL